MVSPPSGRLDSAAYGKAILRQRTIPDLSSNFSRKNLISAATSQSLDEVINEFSFGGYDAIADIKSILIYDDVFGRGRTIAAIIHHLHQAGLSKDCCITAAVALKVK
jgi:predicted amidophosphoribosyltransferase